MTSDRKSYLFTEILSAGAYYTSLLEEDEDQPGIHSMEMAELRDEIDAMWVEVQLDFCLETYVNMMMIRMARGLIPRAAHIPKDVYCHGRDYAIHIAAGLSAEFTYDCLKHEDKFNSGFTAPADFAIPG